MKLHQSILERLIDLPSKEPVAVQDLLDDLGLEVKGVEQSPGGVIYTIESLANRGDHLSALGTAREISARLLSAVKNPSIAPELSAKAASVVVRVATDKCLRYSLMDLALPADLPLRPEIAAVVGAQSGHPAIVDYLNYLQLEIGQPMHAFDRDKIDGEIVVELSTKVEEIRALDGKDYKLPVGSILIRDRKKIVAVAGVIGCENSMCTADTRKVLIECATFDPVAVRLTARAMGLSTDASYAFERGCDPEIIPFALRRLVHLVSGARGSVGGSDAAHVLGISAYAAKTIEKREIVLNPKHIKREMNLPRLNEVEIKTRLKYLGYSIKESPSGELIVGVPSWRLWDVFYEEDLIEDFVRSMSFSAVKLTLPPLSDEPGDFTEIEALQSKVEPVLLGNGFYEVISESFYSSEDLAALSALDPKIAECHVPLANALERTCSHLRATNIVNFAKLVCFNERKGVSSIKVFEQSRLYGLKGPNTSRAGAESDYQFERDVISIAVSGRWFENEFRKPPTVDQLIFQLKGILEGLVSAIGGELSVSALDQPLLHPGRQAVLKVGRTSVGFFGEIHPTLIQKYGLRSGMLYAELDVDALIKVMQSSSAELPSEFPTTSRDLTLKLPVRSLAGQVVKQIADLKPAELESVKIVDDFRKGGEDFRRVSFRLYFQAADRTLASAEVDSTMHSLLAQLKERHGLELA